MRIIFSLFLSLIVAGCATSTHVIEYSADLNFIGNNKYNQRTLPVLNNYKLFDVYRFDEAFKRNAHVRAYLDIDTLGSVTNVKIISTPNDKYNVEIENGLNKLKFCYPTEVPRPNSALKDLRCELPESVKAYEVELFFTLHDYIDRPNYWK